MVSTLNKEIINDYWVNIEDCNIIIKKILLVGCKKVVLVVFENFMEKLTKI